MLLAEFQNIDLYWSLFWLVPVFGLIVSDGLREAAKLHGSGLGGRDFDAMAIGQGGSTLAAQLNSGVTTEMELASTTGYPTSGSVRIYQSPAGPVEEIAYTGIAGSPPRLTGLTRAQSGTSDTTHASGSRVSLITQAGTQKLIAEITSGGGERRSTSQVTATLQTSAFTDDTVRWDTTWTFTAGFTVWELGIFNEGTSNAPVGDSAGEARMLLRQTFGRPLFVVNQDTLQLRVDVTSSDAAAAGDSTITRAGIVEGNKLIATDLTPAFGAMSHLAVGSGSTAVADTQTALTTEITTNGLGRQAATVALDTENVSNDTVKLTATWNVTGTQAVREVGIFNQGSGGTMWMRHVFAANLEFVDTDTFTLNLRYVEQS